MKRDLGEMSREERLCVLLAALVYRLGGNVVITEEEMAAFGGLEFTAGPTDDGGARCAVCAPIASLQ